VPDEPTPLTPEPGDPSLPVGVYRDLEGRFHQLIGLGHHAETGEVLAILVALFPSRSHAIVLEPLVAFQAETTMNGQTVPCYEFVGSVIPGNLLGAS
jgi:hypothetical protein